MAESEYKCFIGGLASATYGYALGKAFSSFGEIIETKVIIDHESGTSSESEIVTFASEQSMKDAIKTMHDQELHGGKITVNETQGHDNGGGSEGDNVALIEIE
ncbi:glycine-rich RNA-binding protein [Lathyrus oleraceus]|uniref:RRM domain-containing protein n=1 Tax=Pisum sativum TaxID=3888 RepID=A0A9D5ABR6_PEA|nr:glycine-rich RNA-binding protein-like [Pisum sativum]KAI5402489.1 hypothetical protein KIW84_050202 [Pisum sativum]